MNTRDPRVWAEQLERLAAAGLPGELPDRTAPAEARAAFANGFRDERGNRPRPTDALLAHLMGLPAPARSAGEPDRDLWLDLLEGRTPEPPPGGPLFPSLDGEGIELWTESELCGLHALSWHALSEAGLRRRVIEAAAWHVATLQPDNATNRPWAVHVFALLHAITGDTGALLHAQTLAHNCRVSTGAPDRLSALILLDAARAVRAVADQTDWWAASD